MRNPRSLALLALVLLGLLGPGRAGAEEPALAVFNFGSKGGVSADQVDALSDALVNELKGLGHLQVLGRSTIQSMLKLEEDRLRAAACGEASCMAEIGGALGVRWIVVGNVSQFEGVYLLNLQVLDAEKVLVAAGVSTQVEGGLEDLLAALPRSARELVQAAAAPMGLGDWTRELIDEDPWFELQAHADLFGGMWSGRRAELNETLDARGDMDGDRAGVGLRFGVRLARLHLVFVQIDWLQEHWRWGFCPLSAPAQPGSPHVPVTVPCDPSLRWRAETDLNTIRALLGYRFAYPVLDWLLPFAELGVGLHYYLPYERTLRDQSQDPPAERSFAFQPDGGLRLALMVGLGAQVILYDPLFLTFSYFWDAPIQAASSSSAMVGVGLRL
ncbi:MAG TPA: CsgG/HfaB family protein [Myxococcota bacterium]|nr:CsgG/HfaB family protein [Myxococcota bacterium]